MKLFDLPKKELSFDTFALTLDSLDGTKPFKEFMDSYTHHLLMEHKSLLDKFYINYLKPDNIPYVDTYPEYSESSNNYRYRFMIFKFDNDYVLVHLKVVDLMNGTRYFHLYHPISLNRIFDNELVTLKGLGAIEHFRQVVRITAEPQEDYWCDNYYNTLESASFMFRSKYTSKHCIKRLDELMEVKFLDRCDNALIQEVEDFSKVWETLRSGLRLNIKSDRKLMECMNDYKDIQMFTCRLNGKLIAFSIFFICLDKYLIVHTAEYLSIGGIEFLQNYCNCSFDEAKMVMYNLSNYIQYKSQYEYLVNRKYEAYYYEGDTHVAKLKSYKPMFFKNLIYYIKVPIQDYIDALEAKK